jgi:hypothetical protein
MSGTISVKHKAEIQEFHRQEEAWSDVLSVPLATYHTYLKAMNLTDAVLDEALKSERELTSNLSDLMESLVQPKRATKIACRIRRELVSCLCLPTTNQQLTIKLVGGVYPLPSAINA